MNKSLAFYINLFTDYLEDELSTKSFMRVYLHVFKKDNQIEKEYYNILEKVFWAIEDFEPDLELFEDGDITEEQLRGEVKRALNYIQFS